MALVELARSPFGVNAEIAQTFLDSHGIGAVVLDGGMNAAFSLPIMFPKRLMVLDEDYDEAHALLKDADLL